MQAADDVAVMQRARDEDRVLLSADTDFGGLLARSGATAPSVVLMRRLVGRRADDQASILLANLPTVVDDVEKGAVVVLADEWIRVRSLPLYGHG